MSWRRAGVVVAVLVGFVGGVATNGLEAFAHSFVDTIDAGAVGFFLTSTAAVWLVLVFSRLASRRWNRPPGAEVR